jgi:hypothetical protein
MLHGRRRAAACAKDDKTVAMYRDACRRSCNEFMDCLRTTREAQPKIRHLSRHEQCRSTSTWPARDRAQVVALGEHDHKTKAQLCLSDESNAVDSCIGSAARAEVERYAKERQRQCEKWPSELAACVMHLPNAHHCKPDEEPMWSTPIETGADGPAVAWSVDLATDDKLDDRDVAGAEPHRGRRRCEGRTRVPRRQAAVAVDNREETVRRGRLDARPDDQWPGPRREHRRGDRHATVGTLRRRSGSDRRGDRRARPDRGQLREKRGCTTKKIGKLPESVSWPEHLVVTREGVFVMSYHYVVAFDRTNKQRLHLAMGDSSQPVYMPHGFAIVDDNGGIVLTSLPGACSSAPRSSSRPRSSRQGRSRTSGCEHCQIARGDCIVKSERSGMATPKLVAMPGGGVAFNDDAITEKTQVMSSSDRRSIQTNG